MAVRRSAGSRAFDPHDRSSLRGSQAFVEHQKAAMSPWSNRFAWNRFERPRGHGTCPCRKPLIEIVLPILCNLKTLLQSSCSPLLKDLMICMFDIFKNCKVEVKEFLANHPTLLQEIECDARQQSQQNTVSTFYQITAPGLFAVCSQLAFQFHSMMIAGTAPDPKA